MTLSQIQSPCSTWTAWTSTSWQRTWLVCKLNPCWWAGIGSNRDYFIVIYPTAHSRCNDSWFLTLPRAQNRLPKLIKRELAEVRLVTHGQTASAISIVSRDPANCFSSDSKAFFFIFSFFLFLVFFPSVILAFLLVRQCFPKFKLMTAINSIAQDQQFPA